MGRCGLNGSDGQHCEDRSAVRSRKALRRFLRLLVRACSCRQLQNIRLSSDVGNPLNEIRNWQADGDGWVGAG